MDYLFEGFKAVCAQAGYSGVLGYGSNPVGWREWLCVCSARHQLGVGLVVEQGGLSVLVLSMGPARLGAPASIGMPIEGCWGSLISFPSMFVRRVGCRLSAVCVSVGVSQPTSPLIQVVWSGTPRSATNARGVRFFWG